MKATFFKMIENIARETSEFQFIKADTAYMADYQKNFPNQYLDVGIAEQNMIGVAAGMALEGFVPMVYSIVNFTTMRCLEQIRVNIAYHNLNVKIVSCGQGFDYGSLGATHHATEDLALMRAIPNITVFCPCDPIETEAVIRSAMKTQGPTYVRLGHGGETCLHKAPLQNYEVGKALQLLAGEEVIVCVTGSIAADVLAAAISINAMGYDVGVYSFPTVKPIDKEFILEKNRTAKLILSVEEHSIIGGLGSAIAEVIAEAPKGRALFQRVGLNDTFSYEIGKRPYLKEYYGMDAEAIKAKIIECLR